MNAADTVKDVVVVGVIVTVAVVAWPLLKSLGSIFGTAGKIVDKASKYIGYATTAVDAPISGLFTTRKGSLWATAMKNATH